MMPARTYATMDKLCGVQQGLEASMMQHRRELSQEFAVRLEHTSHEMEDAAFQRAWRGLRPLLNALEHRLEEYMDSSDARTKSVAQDISDLASKLAEASGEIVSLHAEAKLLAIRSAELGTQLVEEARYREERCEGLADSIRQLQEASAEQMQWRRAFEVDVALRREEASIEASRALSKVESHADRKIRELSDRVEALEERLVQRMDAQVNQCMKDAQAHTLEMASDLGARIQAASAQADEKLAASSLQAKSQVDRCMETLRMEQADASARVLAMARRFSEEKAKQLSTEFQSGLKEATEHTARVGQECSSDIQEAISSAEKRMTDANDSLASDLRGVKESVSRGDTFRCALRRTLRVESAQAKRDNDELSKVHAHARDKLEANFQKQVLDLQEQFSRIEVQLCREASGLDAKISALPIHRTVSEVHEGLVSRCGQLAGEVDGQRQKIDTTVADFSTQCIGLRRDAAEGHALLRREITTVATELEELKAASTSLTNGVIKALQVIGLLDMFPSRGQGIPSPSGTAAAGILRTRIGVDELLVWEKEGNSLATRVTRQWSGRDLDGNSTLLAAICHRLAVEEHAVAKELICKAPFSPVATAAPLSPLSARR